MRPLPPTRAPLRNFRGYLEHYIAGATPVPIHLRSIEIHPEKLCILASGALEIFTSRLPFNHYSRIASHPLS